MLRERIDTLDAQRAALPRSALHEVDSARARAIALTQQRAELTAELRRLASPTRSLLGRVRDPDVVERVRLTSALGGIDQAIDHTRKAETALRGRLGDPEQSRAELDGLERAITQLEHERNGILDQVTDRELQSPGEWARELLGDRPAGSRGHAWDDALRRVARYRLDHAITDSHEPLGPQPADEHRASQWQRARGAVARVEREHTHDHGLDIGR
jgi:hypothetical protein